jgi:hypothetical protein
MMRSHDVRHSRNPAIVSLLGIATVLHLVGCQERPAYLSPTASEAPERYARARAESLRVDQENREAEAAFYRRLGQSRTLRIEPDPAGTSLDPAPDPTSQESETSSSLTQVKP